MTDISKALDPVGREARSGVIAQALGHPVRRRALALMAEHADGVSPMMAARDLEVPLANVAYHFQVLIGLGAIKLKKKKPRRGAVEHFYVTADAFDPNVCPMCGRPMEES